jgi:hypothetical protein
LQTIVAKPKISNSVSFSLFINSITQNSSTYLEIEKQDVSEGLPSTSPRRFKISPHNACNPKNIVTPLNMRGFSTSIQ